MMETAVERATAASRPIHVLADPATRADALANQKAFCDEARRNQMVPPPPTAQQALGSAAPGSDSPNDTPAAPAAAASRPITAVPRMRKCHGWLKIQSEMLNGIHSWLAPERIDLGMKCSRFMQGRREYTAVVYEYVEEGDNDAAAVQEALDFFWLAGFSTTISPLARNWKSSVLVDLSDVVPPRGYAWREEFYKPRDASRVITIGVGLDNNNNNRPVGLRPPPEVMARL